MSNIGEFELIGRISAAANVPPGVTGIGDDCSIMPQRDGLDTLVTTDLLVEDKHFLLSDISPKDLGWKSAAVNISDIAAMGGRPTGAFLSIALPPATHFEQCLSERSGEISPLAAPGRNDKVTDEIAEPCHLERSPEGGVERSSAALAEWVDRFIKGFLELCGRFGVTLLGGDTSSSPDKLFINVTMLGECPHGRALLRSSARPGDMICVTGPLGDAAAGLRLIFERQSGRTLTPYEEALVRRHYRPMPKVLEGQVLAGIAGVHAAMDISDGIASDLMHILDASSVSAEIDLAAVPLSEELRSVCSSRGWDAEELAVCGGEDYELLFTIAPEALDAVQKALEGRCAVIGRVLESNPGRIIWKGGAEEYYKGFTHF